MRSRLAHVPLVAGLVACVHAPSESAIVAADTEQCSSQVVEGLDVYSGTGTVDWSMVASSGRQFVFIKATQGNYDTQSTFPTQWSGALAAHILRSPYHFFDGTIDGVVQADWFLAEVTSAGGLQVGDLPPMLDIECPTSSDESETEAGCEYTGDSGWVATTTLQERILDWLERVQQATGLTPIIYSYPSWFASVDLTTSALADYPLFIATYDTCADVPPPWTSAVFWQYSGTGTIPGVTGDVDEDRFFGSAAGLMALTETAPAPPPADAGVPDAGLPDNENGTTRGCGCATGTLPTSGAALVSGVLALILRPKRRRLRRRIAQA
jgi:GH25 family lysozyme M1 (1,4-beta-N-acetylmuramidase)